MASRHIGKIRLLLSRNRMKNKTILFLHNRECTFLPPFMTILDSLKEEYSLKVISRETKESLAHLQKQYADSDVTFLAVEPEETTRDLKSRISNRVKNVFHALSASHKECLRLLEETQYDLLWVIHEKTAYEEVVYVPFESITAPIMKGYEQYLTLQYGDYMELPPEADRIPKHGFKAYWK